MVQATEIVFRRVVVGFQGPPESRASLEIAAEMARRLRSELAGIFLEDQGLLDWCASGTVRQVSSLGAGPVALEALLRDFSAGAALARTRLASVARALGIEARFETSRADLTDPEVAGPEDLLVVIEPADPSARHSHPFAGMLQRLAAASVPVLYVPHDARIRSGPVVALAARSDEAAAATGARIAGEFGEQLVLIGADGLEPWLAAPGEERLIIIDRGTEPDAASLAALLARRKVPVLIVGRRTPPEEAAR